MKTNKPSSTALFVVNGVYVTMCHPNLKKDVPESFYATFIKPIEYFYGIKSTTFKNLYILWQRFYEFFSIPGIYLHFLLRKKYINHKIRSFIRDNYTQVIILGAGYDGLGERIASEFSQINVFELDYPATNVIKEGLYKNLKWEHDNLFLLSHDLSLQDNIFSDVRIIPEKKTIIICEGLLMYLTEFSVKHIFSSIKKAFPVSAVMGTCMEKRGKSYMFQTARIIVKMWLKIKGEPFLWGIEREKFGNFILDQGGYCQEIKTDIDLKKNFLSRDNQHYKSSGSEFVFTLLFDERGFAMNDKHSALNATYVSNILEPECLQDIQSCILGAIRGRHHIAICGGKHAMGGQQFLRNQKLLDMGKLNKILNFDIQNGTLTVESGAQWPQIVKFLSENQKNSEKPWGIIQKQTGADNLSIGGCVSANIHGRGLGFGPFIQDVIECVIVDADGCEKTVSRERNEELFSLVCGGYGLFGVIYSVTFKLQKKQTLIRHVEIIDVSNLDFIFQKKIVEGYLYGDFQFKTDRDSDDFLQKGVLSCYLPTHEKISETIPHRSLSYNDWMDLYTLAHTDQKTAFEKYSTYYLSTNGQCYDSDNHQMSLYPEGYHDFVDEKIGEIHTHSEMISEIYVPREKIAEFMEKIALYFKKSPVQVFYGTIRLIEKDTESFLRWASEPWVCIILNLHIEHSEKGIQDGKKAFQDVIDMAIEMDGKYYLTYHTWARKDQVLKCYPQLADFLRKKREYDQFEIFSSNWYQYYTDMIL